jgi:hypothetical protein
MSESKISTIESDLINLRSLYIMRKDRAGNEFIYKRFKNLLKFYSTPDKYFTLIITLADLSSIINSHYSEISDMDIELEAELKIAINKVLKPIDTDKLKKDVSGWLKNSKPILIQPDNKSVLDLKKYANFIVNYRNKNS